MSDEQMAPVLRSWMHDTDRTPPDARQSADHVMARVQHTRQLGRWWWLPSFARTTASAPTTDMTTEVQPAPSPATNGQSATVTRSTNSMFSPAKAIAAGVLVFAIGGVLLIAQPFDQQGASVPGAATDGVGLEPASVTGEMKVLRSVRDGGGLEGEIADGVWHEEGPWSGRFEMDDSRLTGDATGYDGGNRYQMDENHVGLAEVGGGTITIENDGGAWEGSTLGVSGTERSDMLRDTMVVELTGTGGYDGLSALLFVDQDQPVSWDRPLPDFEVYGVIVPGELVPEVPAGWPSAAE